MSLFDGAGIGARIAMVALAVAWLALAIVTVGVMIVGGQLFMDLMKAHGESTESSREMFESTVLVVLGVAVLVSVALSVLLAVLAGRWLSRPLRRLSAAARRVARGDYATRIERTGPEEIVSLTDSFNQMSASLEQQERLRREFVANAAHELRTPLTNLKGYLEGLRDGVIRPDRSTFESLWEEVERLVRLSDSLNTLAEEPPSAAVVDVDVTRAIHTAVELSRPAAVARSLRWRLEIPPVLLARADPDHLAQVLANLLQNAVRYTPEGGEITISAEPRPGDVLVAVRNTGAAIAADEMPRLFERFYRIDRSRDRRSGGAGIGLAIVKQLVEMAGGRVGAESRDGSTTFWFTLPAHR
jgi:two-component system, OmpR family, sensor histidine kinase BaeS